MSMCTCLAIPNFIFASCIIHVFGRVTSFERQRASNSLVIVTRGVYTPVPSLLQLRGGQGASEGVDISGAGVHLRRVDA